ncbi:MAG: hypothetical protein EOO36_13455 [Cytophagaceae bacterium]|nr:MAG: hypothetical protein EOO36_13455 [Cytophagaceae bacterium]
MPLPTPGASPHHVSARSYYQLPERIAYKNCPVYAPPKGYWEWLHKQAPQVVFDPNTLRTEADWIRAGELLFELPIDVDGAILSAADARNPDLYAATHLPLTKEGIMPYARYVVPEKGKVLLGNLSCAICHTRVQPDAPC